VADCPLALSSPDAPKKRYLLGTSRGPGTPWPGNVGEAKGLPWLRNHLDYCATALLSEPWVLDIDRYRKALVRPSGRRPRLATIGTSPARRGVRVTGLWRYTEIRGSLAPRPKPETCFARTRAAFAGDGTGERGEASRPTILRTPRGRFAPALESMRARHACLHTCSPSPGSSHAG
jgi:hypothetical protein